MAPKRATFYTFANDTICHDAKQFIEDSGVLLTVRKLDENPLTVFELKNLIGHIDVKHFLNTAAPEYTKLNIAEILHDRKALFQLIADNNSLLRRPIITTIRLITIGCDKKRLAEMLQISQGNIHHEEPKGNLKNSKYVTRRTISKSSDSKPSTSSARASK